MTKHACLLDRRRKTVLIDAVWTPFADAFDANLTHGIDLDIFDWIIANHGEVEHSGALPALMKQISNKPIYCTANTV